MVTPWKCTTWKIHPTAKEIIAALLLGNNKGLSERPRPWAGERGRKALTGEPPVGPLIGFGCLAFSLALRGSPPVQTGLARSALACFFLLPLYTPGDRPMFGVLGVFFFTIRTNLWNGELLSLILHLAAVFTVSKGNLLRRNLKRPGVTYVISKMT